MICALSPSLPVISIVVPMFNEQENVSHFLSRLVPVMEALDENYEIIIVDDGSKDATWANLLQECAVYPQLRGIRLSRNFGHQAALLAGLSMARGRAVISMDGDLQHPPEVIPRIVAEWTGGAAVVTTRRYYNASTSSFKKMTSALYYRVFSSLSDVHMAEGHSDFRLLDRRALTQLLNFRQSDIFLRGAVSWLNFQSATVEFEAAERFSGQSKYNLRKMVRFARSGILAFSTKPLKVGIAMGLITSAMAFFYLIYIVIQYSHGETVPGWASTLGFLSLLFGVLFIMLGIIGTYLGNIYVMLQHRPAYVIDEVCEIPSNERHA
jgi:glycosyltransferase involved in cell wall biosynthesis